MSMVDGWRCILCGTVTTLTASQCLLLSLGLYPLKCPCCKRLAPHHIIRGGIKA